MCVNLVISSYTQVHAQKRRVSVPSIQKSCRHVELAAGLLKESESSAPRGTNSEVIIHYKHNINSYGSLGFFASSPSVDKNMEGVLVVRGGARTPSKHC